VSVLAGWLRVALVDMRGDLRRFAVLLACLALGVGTIAMVGGVGAALQNGLTRDARLVLGGDLEAQLSYRAANPDERALFGSLGTVGEVIEVLGRGRVEGGSAFLSLRAVDENYPLLGEVVIDGADAPPAELLAARDGVFGVVVNSLLLDRLSIGIGDMLTIGEAQFQIRGVLKSLPDQVTQGVTLGVPAMLSVAGLDTTGILKPGVLARYRYKLLLDAGTSFDAAAAAISTGFPDAGWDVHSPADATADLARFFDIFSRFLTIVGLSALLVGGVGVSNAVAAYISERQRSIATLRSLGATGARIMVHFLTQVMILTLLGIALGLLLGAVLTVAALPVIGNLLAINLPPQVDVQSLATAAAFGLLIGFAFAYLPLQRAQAMRPALLFRAAGAGSDGGLHWRDLLRPTVAVPLLIAAAGIYGLAALTTGRPLLVLYYTLGVIAAFAALRLAAFMMQRGLKLLPPLPHAGMRNAIKAIYRPGAPAPTVILSLGLGLALLLLIALIDNNLRHQLNGEVMADAPTFVFMDLFDDEAAELATLPQSDPRIESFRSTPMLRGAIESVNGTPVAELGPLPEEFSFIFEGEIPLTFSASLPEQSTVLSGAWWRENHSGEAEVSVFERLRAPLRLKLGDELQFMIFGEPLTAKIANFRDYEWRGGNINFAFVLSPGAIEKFPLSYLGLLKARAGEEDAVQQSLVKAYPDLIFLPVGEALAAIAVVINAVVNAIAIIGGLALLSGLLVLAGAMAAGRKQREADAVVQKVLGATRGDVLAAYLIEYGLLGALSAVLAAALGVAGAWAFVTQVLEIDFALDPLLLVLVILGAIGLTIAVGALTTWSALSVRPAPFLRADG
jgi:putative ABC transport system permease protein